METNRATFLAAAAGTVAFVSASPTSLSLSLSGTNSGWQQPFTVTATATGTCYFTLLDGETGVTSQQVTVAIGS
jgi:hypothetical protein